MFSGLALTKSVLLRASTVTASASRPERAVAVTPAGRPGRYRPCCTSAFNIVATLILMVVNSYVLQQLDLAATYWHLMALGADRGDRDRRL